MKQVLLHDEKDYELLDLLPGLPLFETDQG